MTLNTSRQAVPSFLFDLCFGGGGGGGRSLPLVRF